MNFLEQLEARQLLSFSAFGANSVVPAVGTSVSTDAAVAENGSFIVASAINHKGSYSLQATRYSATGQQIGKTLVLFAQKAVTINQVATSIDADGDAVVAYEARSDAFFGDTRIYLNRISKSDEVSNAEIVGQAQNAEQFVFDPDVSMDAKGGYFVVWTTGSFAGLDDIVTRVHAYDASGKSRGAEFTAGANDDVDPRAAAKPDGSGAVVTFRSGGETSEAAAVAVLTPTARATNGFSQATFQWTVTPSIAVSADGSGLLAYTVVDRNSQELIDGYVQHFDTTGTLADPIKIVGPDPDLPVASIEVDLLPDNSFVAAFTQKVGNVETRYVQRFTESGTPESSPTKLGSFRFGNTYFFRDHPIFNISAEEDNGTVIYAFVDDDDAKTHYQRFTPDIAALDHGVLYVNGTDSKDSLVVSRKALSVVVQGSSVRKFDATQVSSIIINGAASDDFLDNATALPATISGGKGNDTISGGIDKDEIHGNDGNDSILGSSGEDRLFGDAGRDTISGNGENDLILGGDDRDSLLGQDGGDSIFGDAGPDKILGGAGADLLAGGASNDTLFGESGPDSILGEGGSDELHGGLGVDTLRGNGGNDLLVSNDDIEQDLLFGDGGSDTSRAGKNDVLTSIEVPL